jgi:hypothetical protein
MGLHREGSNNDVVGYIVYTNQGYFFNVYASRNTSASNPPGDMFVTANQGVWYDEPGCSGEGWIPSGVPEGARNYSLVPITQGAVFRHPSGRTFYVAKNVVPAPTGGGVAVAQSQRYMDGSCLASAGHAGQFKIAVLPNDPTVTGVPNETIQRPINLVR